MASEKAEEPPVSWSSTTSRIPLYDGPPRNIATIDALDFGAQLTPKKYDMAGTHPDSKIMFLDVEILDSTGKLPYRGDVLIEGMSTLARYSCTVVWLSVGIAAINDWRRRENNRRRKHSWERRTQEKLPGTENLRARPYLNVWPRRCSYPSLLEWRRS